MCGFAVFWDRVAATTEAELTYRGLRMREALAHRGPDGAGLWLDAKAGIVLGHRRLAVLDLSVAAAQPMASASGRWYVAFNGEIYNHHELRNSLPAVGWRGRSDTEVLCSLLEKNGVEGTLPLLRGMFAFAAFDTRRQSLWLARDRLGQKPLYFHHGPRYLLVGSELRALRADAACPADIDRGSLASVVSHGYVPQPRTILCGVEQVPAGGWVRISIDGTRRATQWWSVVEAARKPPPSDYNEALDALDAAVGEAVELRARADVPLGTLLSGGIDSTLVTAYLAERLDRVRTFTVGVEGEGYDESAAAAAVARHLGTEHTSLHLPALQVEALAEALPTLQDEPMADPSLLPTWLIAKEARSHVTVAIGGDGGDEFFGGYPHYDRAIRAYALAGRIPRGLRGIGAAVVGPMERISEGMARRRGGAHPSRAFRRAGQITASSLAQLYARCMTSTMYPQLYVVGVPALPAAVLQTVPGHDVRALMVEDQNRFLLNDILVKSDRSGMAVALEIRAPLLDTAVVELASCFPSAWTWNAGQGKRALKDLLVRKVPLELWNRPKQGFRVPLADWLRGPLRPWAEDLLLSPTMEASEWWNVDPIRQRWRELMEGYPVEALLWRILLAEAWRRRGTVPP